MSFPDVEKIVLDAVDAFVALGVSRAAAEQAARAAEEIVILDLIQTQSDRRLLDLFKQYGSAKLSRRRRVCQKTIRTKVNAAAARLAGKEIGTVAPVEVTA